MKQVMTKNSAGASCRRGLAVRALLATLLVCSLLSAGALAAVPEKQDVYVLDQANVLSGETEQQIIGFNEVLYTTANRAELVVVTVDFLDGMDIRDYAYKLFNDWEIGDASENNGVLLLLAIGEDNYYAQAGSGIEDVLSGGVLDDLLWNYLEEDFAEKDYDAGVIAFCGQVTDVLGDHYASIGGTTQPNGSGVPEPDDGIGGLLVAVVVFVVLAVVVIGLVIGLGMRSIWYPRPYVGRRYYGGPFWWGMPRRYGHRPPPPPPGDRPGEPHQSAPNQRPSGGASRGGGAGRRGAGFGGGSFGGGFGGFSGGGRIGGGGSRGGGAGRR